MAENGNGPEGAPRLPPERVAELLSEGQIVLVDVREDHEWEAGHIPGAVHVAINDLPAHAEGLGTEQPVVVYCRSGNRSGLAADALRSGGFDASAVDGGIAAWHGHDLELEPPDG